MTVQDRWLLPEGIDEALPEQAALLEYHRRRILDLYRSWGYAQVVTPFIEYLESLLTGTSHDLDLQTFKLTDQLNGRLMGVRADMTPQVARIDAHVLKGDEPARLCYFGTVLRTRIDALGGSRSPMQVGAELYGHEGADSDVEIIRLMLETMALVGIPGVHLDLGHVGIYGGLVRQAGLDRELEYALFDMLQRKAHPEIDVLLRQMDLQPAIKVMLGSLAELHGGREVLEQARSALGPGSAEVLQVVDHLERLADALLRFFPDLELHFDLAELRGYHYHTGVVFAAYAPGHGEEIARGGRYDNIGRVFGRERPATGFSADLKVLCRLSPRDEVPGRSAIFVPAADVFAAQATVRRLREAGETVVYGLEGQKAGPRKMGCARLLVRVNNEWIVKELD